MSQHALQWTLVSRNALFWLLSCDKFSTERLFDGRFSRMDFIIAWDDLIYYDQNTHLLLRICLDLTICDNGTHFASRIWSRILSEGHQTMGDKTVMAHTALYAWSQYQIQSAHMLQEVNFDAGVIDRGGFIQVSQQASHLQYLSNCLAVT